MLEFQKQGQGDNRILASVYNMTGSTLGLGSVVCYYTSAGGVCDGFSVTTPATGYLDLVAGIVADTDRSTGIAGILTLTAGFIVIYGVVYKAYRNHASDACAIGDKLLPVAGQTYLTYVAAGDGRDGFFCCLSSYASSAGAITHAISVFVRAM